MLANWTRWLSRSLEALNFVLKRKTKPLRKGSENVPDARILICPADVRSSQSPNVRVPARDFTVFGNANLSYFVGIDAKKAKGSSFLCGVSEYSACYHSTTAARSGLMTKLQRLKKRKLLLKDQITKIESELLPDIIA